MIELVKQDEPAFESRFVIGVRKHQADQESLQARSFGPAELGILQIDVVDDLGDLREGAIRDSRSRQQRLERAAVFFVGEVAADHVEAQLARSDVDRLGVYEV